MTTTRIPLRRLARLAASVALAGALAMPLAAAARPGANFVPRHRGHAAPVRHAAPHRVLAGVANFPVGTERPNLEVFLSLGQGELINLPGSAASVWTSNPAAADVYVNNPHQINLFGKSFGEATIFATGADGRIVYAANVHVSQNVSAVDQTLKSAMPNSDIHVMLVGQTAILNGTVASPADSTEAENMVKMLLNPGQKISGDDPLKVAVVNRLRTATPMQVYLQVRIAEVNRSLSRTISTNLASANTSNGFQYGIGQGRSFISSSQAGSGALGVGVNPYTYVSDPTAVTATNPLGLVKTPQTGVGVLQTATTLAAQGHLFGMDIIAALDAGEQVGLVTTLAEPNLTAISGETADFLAGGEFPIPISEGLGAVSVDYKKYGVSLSYTPTVLANGRISLHVRPEVSELSTQGSVTLNGFTIPALTVRRTETTVELGSGQSFMIAGLLQNSATNTIQKLPGAGDLPVLGNLFKSTAFQKGETELVIIVTPYLVQPTDAANIKLPTDGYQNPNDVQRLMANMMSDGKSGVVGLRPGPTSVSQLPADGTGGAPASKGADAGGGKPGSGKPQHAAAGDAATPGFSLN